MLNPKGRQRDPNRNQRVFEALARAGEPRSTGEIAADTGLDQRGASQALSKLLAEGRVQRSRSGGQGAPAGEKERRWRIHPRLTPSASTAPP